MKRTILVLSLLLSLLGILRSFFFVFYDFEEVTEFLNFIIFSIQPYSFNGMTIYVPRYLIHGNAEGRGTITMGLVNLSFYLTFLSGTIIYYFSKYKETKLLFFNYSLVFLDSVIKICFFIFLFNIDKFRIYDALYILVTLLYIFIAYYFITKEVKSSTIQNDNQAIDNYLENASNSKRFLNLFIDTFIIIIIIFGLLSYAERNDKLTNFFGFGSVFEDKFPLLIFFSTIKFIYYLLFESIFKSTPAKFITACYVTDEEGNSPNFSTILKRTLLRFVPFESFSFLLGKNLHDDYSDTYVVNKKTDRKTEDRYTLFLTVAFGILLVIYFYMSNRDIY